MKNLILIIVSLVLVQSIKAQTKSCAVLLEKISGKYIGKCQDGLANGKGKSIGEDTYMGVLKMGYLMEKENIYSKTVMFFKDIGKTVKKMVKENLNIV